MDSTELAVKRRSHILILMGQTRGNIPCHSTNGTWLISDCCPSNEVKIRIDEIIELFRALKCYS